MGGEGRKREGERREERRKGERRGEEEKEREGREARGERKERSKISNKKKTFSERMTSNYIIPTCVFLNKRHGLRSVATILSRYG